jgi:type I restriction-modification system DNA methylase subunit
MTQALEAALIELSKVKDSFNEDDIERLFQGVYLELGYTTVGRDILGKRKSKKSGIPDVRLLNSDDSIQVVVELKKPAENLSDHENQLFAYMRDLKSPYGLLSNGRELWLYKREGLNVRLVAKYTAQDLAADATSLEPFRKQHLEATDFKQVKTRFEEAKREGLVLTDVESVQAEQFLNTFDLTPGSPFGELVAKTQTLLGELIGSSDFVTGAYDFWKKTYARDPGDDIPKVWREFLTTTGREDVYRFMFALETAYLLTARLILAKGIQDHDRDSRISTDHIADRFLMQLDTRKSGRTHKIPETAYLEATQTLFNDYAKTLFTSIYAQDLFDWWRDYGKSSEATRNTFALALARLVLSLVRFDFKELQGDLLGELYQSYFDPETRKALGEFYTPPEVVDFILDEVGYDGEGRLLDPATGSGTFLIRALRRYLQNSEGKDPIDTLNGLTREFNLVAFDVNPFAVLMAQVNVAAHLVPLYAKAIEKDKDLVLRRLPIVRTDSLRQEVIEGETLQKGTQFGFDFGGEEITAYIELPVKTSNGPLRVGLTFPSLDSAKEQGFIRNEREWLLALQAVFAAVEVLSQAYDAKSKLPDLQTNLRKELSLYNPSPDKLADYLQPYAQKVWETLQNLKDNHGDGRFLKTLEDLMLGLVLKHYLQYDYVVGNPPYVRVQNLPDILKEYWEGKYTWAKGNYDIFIPFIERVLYGDRPWLKDGGRLGYIVSNSFLNTEAGEQLRTNLPKVAKVISISDFKAVRFLDGNLFEGAMTYTCVITLERDVTPNKNYTFRASRFYPRNVPLAKAEAVRNLNKLSKVVTKKDAHTTAKVDEADYMDIFWEKSTTLNERGWFLMPEREHKVFQQLEAIGDSLDSSLPAKLTDQKRRLLNYTATTSGGFQGIATGLDDVLLLKQVDEDKKKNLLCVEPRGGGDAIWIEKNALRPFLLGKDVERWHVGWEGWWVIFPYFRQKGRFWFMPSTDYWHKEVEVKRSKNKIKIKLFQNWPDASPMIEETYPKLWEYLKVNEKSLREREVGRYKKGKDDGWRWYDLARPQNFEATESKKIVAQLLARSAQFAFEDEGGIHFQAGGKGGGVYGVLLQPSYRGCKEFRV